MKSLNLGCGTDIRKGWVNLDKVGLPGVGVVHDLDRFPYPFKDNEFDFVLCKDVLEHVKDFNRVLKEIHRILKKGGKVEVSVPHFNSVDSYGDPTHRKLFSSETFLFFLKGHKRSYYFDFSFDKVSVKITFLKKWYLPYNFIIEPLVNINNSSRLFYESTFLRVFPSFNLRVEMVK